jgi:hypothetical protein
VAVVDERGCERVDPGGVDAVVVGHEDPHAPTVPAACSRSTVRSAADG